MQIGSQTASQINNIEHLNWNFNMWWNTFNLHIEMQKNEKEIIDFLSQIQSELKAKWIYSQEIQNWEMVLKNNIQKRSTDWIVDWFKEYAWKVKEVTETTEQLSDTFWKLYKLWSTIGSFITLLF